MNSLAICYLELKNKDWHNIVYFLISVSKFIIQTQEPNNSDGEENLHSRKKLTYKEVRLKNKGWLRKLVNMWVNQSNHWWLKIITTFWGVLTQAGWCCQVPDSWFGWVHNLRLLRWSPESGSMFSTESAWVSSLPLPPAPQHMCMHALTHTLSNILRIITICRGMKKKLKYILRTCKVSQMLRSKKVNIVTKSRSSLGILIVVETLDAPPITSLPIQVHRQLWETFKTCVFSMPDVFLLHH